MEKTETKVDTKVKQDNATSLGDIKFAGDVEKGKELSLANPEKIMNDLNLVSGEKILTEDKISPKVTQVANAYLEKLLKLNPQDSKNFKEQRSCEIAVKNLGVDAQKQLERTSELLERPLADFSKNNSNKDSQDVGEVLLTLKDTVTELNPDKFFSSEGLTGALGKIPGFGKTMKRYVEKCKSADSVIQTIKVALERGKQRLTMNNETLMCDKDAMRGATILLQDHLQLALLLKQMIDAEYNKMDASDPRREFIGTKILFHLNQRILDLQESLGINQNGVLTYGVIIDNNNELIRGTFRAQTNTMAALRIAMTLAIALDDQERQLKAVKAANETTADLTLSAAKRLKTQGVEIQKQASGPNLDINRVSEAINLAISAIDDVANYRLMALEQQTTYIRQYKELNDRSEKKIREVEMGDSVEPLLNIGSKDGQ